MQYPKKFNPGLLKFVKGNACHPWGGSHKLLLQVNNDIGAYGAGFSGALAKKWPKVELEYRKWFRSQNKFVGGEIQIVEVQSDVSVINMIAQEGVRASETDPPALRLEWLSNCLEKAAKVAMDRGSTIHAPRIGCGLAGGKWEEVEPLLKSAFINKGINVTIYDL